MAKTGAKGFVAEEALRLYFINAGYFVVQGIPLNYKNQIVTDVDLWLYLKATSQSAVRTCVDVKNKRNSRAMERIFWTKGLKEVLNVDRAMVITKDNRPETRDFGATHGVGVLQGDFLQRIIKGFPTNDRLTEGELLSLLKSPCVVDSKLKWNKWYLESKTNLLHSLNFDGCNKYLLGCKILLDEYICTKNTSEVSIRLLYIIIAYFLICLDFTSRSFVHLSSTARNDLLTNGFSYGESGRQRAVEIVQMALEFLTFTGKEDLFSGEDLRRQFDKHITDINAEILGEHFSKMESLNNLFPLARRFEEQAYSKVLLYPHESSSELKTIVGLICDLTGHDRKKVL